MKAIFALVSVLFAAQLSHAGDAESCAYAAERAAYATWYKPSDWAIGDIQSGATDVVWERNGVISYQVSVQYRKPDSQSVSWANYSVRVNAADCSIVKIRKF